MCVVPPHWVVRGDCPPSTNTAQHPQHTPAVLGTRRSHGSADSQVGDTGSYPRSEHLLWPELGSGDGVHLLLLAVSTVPCKGHGKEVMCGLYSAGVA